MGMRIVDELATEDRKSPHELLVECINRATKRRDLCVLEVWLLRGYYETGHDLIAEAWKLKTAELKYSGRFVLDAFLIHKKQVTQAVERAAHEAVQRQLQDANM